MLVWAVPYCYWNGYVDDFSVDNFETMMGVPKWVFIGIVAPWLVADVFTTWFCFCYMKDDDLGGEGEDAAVEGDAGSEEQPS